jgi:hypothetical protein
LASRTLANLRLDVGRLVDRRYLSGASTAVGSGTLTDTSSDGPTLYPDDYFNNSWLVDSAARAFLITNFVQSTGVFTLRPTATPATGAYEVHSFAPQQFVDALNDAALTLYNRYGLGRTLADEGLVVNSPLYNGGFEEWSSSSAAVGWAVSSSTLTRESFATAGRAVPGSRYAAKLTSTAGYLVPASTHRPELLQLRGSTITVYAWCNSNTSSSARLAFSNGVSVTYGSYHAGDSAHRLLSVEVAVGENVSTVEPRLMHDNSGASDYWDNVWIEGGPSLSTYRCPNHFAFGPDRIMYRPILSRDELLYGADQAVTGWSYLRQSDAGSSDEIATLMFHPQLVGLGRLRLEAQVPGNTLSADTDVIELHAVEAQLLTVEAAIRLLERSISTQPVRNQMDYRMRIASLMAQRAQLAASIEHGTATSLPLDV